MMKIMRCTYLEYLAQPHVEMCVFESFERGLAEARDMLNQRADAVARNKSQAAA